MENGTIESRSAFEVREQLRFNIWRTESWLRSGMKEFLEHYNVTVQQVNILRILREAGQPLSTKAIAERMIDRSSDTSRIVDRMIAKDLLRKRKDSTDKRLVQISINFEGLKLLSQIEDEIGKVDSKLFSLETKELELLNSLLEKVIA